MLEELKDAVVRAAITLMNKELDADPNLLDMQDFKSDELRKLYESLDDLRNHIEKTMPAPEGKEILKTILVAGYGCE